MDLTLAAVLWHRRYQPLLMVDHAMPMALMNDGHQLQAVLWDAAVQAIRQDGRLPSWPYLVHQAVRAGTPTHSLVTSEQLNQKMQQLEGIWQRSSDGPAVQRVVADTMTTYLVAQPKAEGWQQWVGGPPPESDELANRAAEEIGAILRRGSEPEGFLTDEQVMQMSAESVELVNGVLIAGQIGIIGGPQKTLKTLLALDMALSLATGTPWLGNSGWQCPARKRVAFCSGESGGPILLRKRRLMEATKRSQLLAEERRCFDEFVQTNFTWETRRAHLPDLSDPASIERLRRQIARHRIEVLFLDPLLLLMGVAAKDMANPSSTGQVLLRAADAFHSEGCTLVLVHHTAGDRARRQGGQGYEPLELNDLAYTGITHFVRQWVLVSRAGPYSEDGRRSDLWLAIGGSGGQAGGTYRGTITEGHAHDRWEVSMATRSAYREEVGRMSELRQREQERSDEERVLSFIRQNPRTSRNAMARDQTVLGGLGAAAIVRAIGALLGRHAIRETPNARGVSYEVIESPVPFRG